jgi:hypothetical protein
MIMVRYITPIIVFPNSVVAILPTTAIEGGTAT